MKTYDSLITKVTHKSR